MAAMNDASRPPRLFIPGPVEVEEDVLQAMAGPMIGHRAPEIGELIGAIRPMAEKLLRTSRPVYLMTNSATGAMETAAINCIRRKVLSCVNGAFSKRFAEICENHGYEVTRLEAEWGKPILPGMIKEKLDEGGYDAVTVVHNETSTGVMSPLAEIACTVAGYDDIVLLVDAVTSAAAVPIETEKLGIDALVTGSQKALALPPGLALCTVSERALERAKEKQLRGEYFDLLKIHKSWEKDQTPTTPAVPQFRALRKRLEKIHADEDAWYADIAAKCAMTREWAKDRFGLFPDEEYASVSLTCVENTRGTSIADLNSYLREHGFMLSNGYKDLKEKTFRIGHMGANTMEHHEQLLGLIDAYLER